MKKIITTAAMIAAVSFGAMSASANVGAGAAFDAHYVSNSNCFSCHTGTPGTLIQLGIDWKAQGGGKDSGPTTVAGWDNLDALYSTTYGGVEPTWVAPAAATASTSSGGCVTSSATTPLMMVLAMLALGFFVRRKKS